MLAKDKVITVVGPTCTGKSDLGVRLAMELNGEIVNADSMQLYLHFDIGTAKPDKETRRLVRHHLIDLIMPQEESNAAVFRGLAAEAVSDILSRGRVPVIVGGTGLYMRALIYGLFTAPRDDGMRRALQERYERDPLVLYEELKSIDYAYAMKISHRDRIRVVRALEIYYLTGTAMSLWEQTHGFKDPRYDALWVGLRRDRQELYSRIDDRVDAMLSMGWVDEVKRLLAAGYSPELKPFSSIGYREILLYLKGSITYTDMVKEIKMHTRNYAKRQQTWFAKEQGIDWHTYPEEVTPILERARRFIANGTR